MSWLFQEFLVRDPNDGFDRLQPVGSSRLFLDVLDKFTQHRDEPRYDVRVS